MAQPRRVHVKVEALGLEDGQRLETRALAPQGSSTLRLDYRHTISLRRGQSEWDVLSRAIGDARTKGLRLFFVLRTSFAPAAAAHFLTNLDNTFVPRF